MQKNENTFVLAGILFVITATVALLLSLVNHVTAEKIAAQTEKEQTEARTAVLSAADSFTELSYLPAADSPVTRIFEGRAGGQAVGYCVHAAPAGYGGTIDLVIGITPEGQVEAVKIVSMSETPGLGSKAQDASFIGQFAGKGAEEPFSVIKSGEPEAHEIAAISGATVTSRAVTDGVNAAVAAVREMEADGR